MRKKPLIAFVSNGFPAHVKIERRVGKENILVTAEGKSLAGHIFHILAAPLLIRRTTSSYNKARILPWKEMEYY